jgi:hypothetical protein
LRLPRLLPAAVVRIHHNQPSRQIKTQVFPSPLLFATGIHWASGSPTGDAVADGIAVVNAARDNVGYSTTIGIDLELSTSSQKSRFLSPWQLGHGT